MFPSGGLHQTGPQAHGTWTVVPLVLDGSWLHGFEAHDHDHVGGAPAHEGASQLDPCTPRGACIVLVVDGNLGHAELVEDALSRRRLSVGVAGDSGLDVVVRDVGIQERLGAGFEPQLGVWSELSGLEELGQADTQDICVVGGRHSAS